MALVELFSQYRLKKVLEVDKFTIYKVKVLTFMVADLKNYLEFLQRFIFLHNQRCYKGSKCKCQKVIDFLKDPLSDLSETKIWYEFITSYVES